MAITSTGFQAPATSREGLIPSVHDQIILIGAQDTPLLSLIGTSSVTGITHSWIIDPMPDPVNKPQLEISSFKGLTKSTKQKTTNAVQITISEVQVSQTMQHVKTYGGNELAHEVAKQAKAHALKLEYSLFGLGHNVDSKESVFTAPRVRDDSNAGISAGLFYFAAKGKASFSAGRRGNVIAFDESQNWQGEEQELTWERFNEILQPIWDSGESPKDIFVGASLKARINEFIKAYGVRYVDNGEKSLNGIINRIETDFGTVNIHLHRYLSEKHGLGDVVIAGNFDYVKQGLLVPTNLKDVPTDKTATAKRYYTEGCLEVRNAEAISIGVGLK